MNSLSSLAPLLLVLATIFSGAAAVYWKGKEPPADGLRFTVVGDGAGFPRTFRCDSGETATLQAAPQRVAAVSLQAEEILVEIAGTQILAAATDKARDPFISHIAGKLGGTPEKVSGNSAEHIVRLHPDLVIITPFTDRRAGEFLKRCRLPVFTLPYPESIQAIDRTIEFLGQLTGRESAAGALRNSMSGRLEAVRRRPQRGGPPEILHYSDLGMPWVAGSGTIIDEIIRLAGGVNLAARRGRIGSQAIRKEILARWNPPFLLIEGEEDQRAALLEGLRRDPVFRKVAAVRDGYVIAIPTRTITSVSHHVVDAVERLAAALDALRGGS